MPQIGVQFASEQGKTMTDEDWEFNRIEMESNARKMAVQYALQKQLEPSPIPLITDEEWAVLNEIPKA